MIEKKNVWQKIKSIIFWGESTIEQKNVTRAHAKLCIKWVSVLLLISSFLYMLLPDLYKVYPLMFVLVLLVFLASQIWVLITGVEPPGE